MQIQFVVITFLCVFQCIVLLTKREVAQRVGSDLGVGLHTLPLPPGMENDDSAVQYAIGRSDTVAPGVGIDLEFDADVQTMSPEASEYETCYVTSHKGPCRVASYSRDGQLIATGSADASIKILDTERMLAKSAMPIEVGPPSTPWSPSLPPRQCPPSHCS